MARMVSADPEVQLHFVLHQKLGQLMVLILLIKTNFDSWTFCFFYEMSERLLISVAVCIWFLKASPKRYPTVGQGHSQEPLLICKKNAARSHPILVFPKTATESLHF